MIRLEKNGRNLSAGSFLFLSQLFQSLFYNKKVFSRGFRLLAQLSGERKSPLLDEVSDEAI